jgi:hypothetical protein
VKLLLAFPQRRAVPEPVVHARAAHEAQRREPEDGAGTHLILPLWLLSRVRLSRALGAPESKRLYPRAPAERMLFASARLRWVEETSKRVQVSRTALVQALLSWRTVRASVLLPLARLNSRRRATRRARACLTRTLSPRSPPNSHRAAASTNVQPAPSKTYNTLILCLQARSRARNPARAHATPARAPPPQHAGKAQALGIWT